VPRLSGGRRVRLLPETGSGLGAHLQPSRRIGVTVHPRACGERSALRPRALKSTGSSPRMRGTHNGRRRGPSPPRFIPAHAGNAQSRRYAHMDSPVHPRACGERLPARNSDLANDGSSPRMRGTPFGLPFSTRLVRFIPAHAGNARIVPSMVHCRSVHPRACGERCSSAAIKSSLGGSSPRMRGTHLMLPDEFIWWAVHPRACGERHFRGGSTTR
jgi:hypothetical protein